MTAVDDRGSAYSRSAHKLLDRMRQSRSGWGEAEVRKLYDRFGFVGRDVGDHVCYYHPFHRDLHGQVPRHRSLRDYVVDDAVDAIDELLRREGEESNGQGP